MSFSFLLWIVSYVVCRTLAGNISSCCGLEWLLASPFIVLNSASLIYCESQRQYLGAYKGKGSICQCKVNAMQYQPSVCYSLINYTSIAGPTPMCSSNGCSLGMRPYPTGSFISCLHTSQIYPLEFVNFTLSETACQGKFLFMWLVLWLSRIAYRFSWMLAL